MIWLIPLCINNLLIFAPEIAIPAAFEERLIESAFRLPSGLLGAVAHVESRGNHRVISRTGDYGLLQINCTVWKRKLPIRSCRELLDRRRNLVSGAWILSRCHRRWEHLPDQAWIGAYNAGTPHGPRAIAYRDGVVRRMVTNRTSPYLVRVGATGP
jgi:soluble lytic murein transglycosylase-like protein